MMTTASTMPASALPLLQRLAAGDIFWVDQKNAEAQAVLKNGHAYIAATLPMRPAMSPVLITLVPTEEGIEASEKQRAFFRDLDDAEVAKEVQATRDAVERITAYEAEQKAAYEHARDSGRWVVDAALPESDWSRTPALTVRPAASIEPETPAQDVHWTTTATLDRLVTEAGKVMHPGDHDVPTIAALALLAEFRAMDDQDLLWDEFEESDVPHIMAELSSRIGLADADLEDENGDE